MVWVYLIAAPENERDADALAEWLSRRGHVVRTEYGRFHFPPARPNEVTLALWSRAALMSSMQMFLVNRAIDAWEKDALVMVKLEHGIAPRGLADLEMVDLTFEAARTSRYVDVDRALRAVDPLGPTRAPRREASQDDAPGAPPSPSPAKPPKMYRRGPLFGGLGDLFARKKRSAEAEPPTPAPAPEQAADDDRGEAGRPGEIFVSYAHADKGVVYPLVDDIEALGRSVWIDRDDMTAGQGWAGMIVRAIKGSDAFCLMCSAQAFASNHVRREVYLADKYERALMPVRLDGAAMPDDIEYFLIDRQWIDLASLDEARRAAALREAFGAAG